MASEMYIGLPTFCGPVMTTQRQPGGRRASKLQREFASEILERFDKSGDVTVLRSAIEHFARTGDFSPFSKRDQHLQKRAIFLRLRVKSQQLRGADLDDYVNAIGLKYGLSEKTVRRMLDPKRDLNLTLTGQDALLSYMHQQAQSRNKPPK